MLLRRAAHASVLVVPALLALACGKTSGKVLEKVDQGVVAEDALRVEVFIPRAVESCATGQACSVNDPARCFTLTSDAGAVTYFQPSSVDFLPPTDPRVAEASLSGCFRLVVTPAIRTSAAQAFVRLTERISVLSERRVRLDVRIHDLDTVAAGFKRWENGTGIFLQPTPLEAAGLPLVTADMDYSFAITGEPDFGFGPAPKIAACGGSNWELQGGFGGSTYTWLSHTCADYENVLFHFFTQSYFSARDLMGFDVTPRSACGRADLDPSTWFPSASDCFVDPDSPTCGDGSCVSIDDAFAAHILTAHFPDPFIGNHCRNGVEEPSFGETAIDVGGVCDRLGRLKP